MSIINVESEIEPLKEVLLHRPGKELLNLTKNTLNKLLFDEIPCLEKAQKEHDEFAKKLKENGVKVVYLEDLVSETLISPQIKDKFIKQFIEEASVKSKYKIQVYNYLNSIKDIKKMVLKTMEGIKKEDIKLKSPFFITDPMPNLYFTRDNFSSINNGISLNKMSSLTRSRETIYGEYIFNYHPKYKDKVTKYYSRYEKYHIEGGDIINLNSHTLLIGINLLLSSSLGACRLIAKFTCRGKSANS